VAELPDDQQDDILSMLADGQLCPQCGAALGPDAFSVARSETRAIRLALSCARCGCTSVVTVSIDSSASLSADLTPDEAFRFSRTTPLSERDCDRMHDLLRAHAGDLLDLLGHDPDSRNT
jgi:hypothetical protein